MKKTFAIFLALLLLGTFSFTVVGCKKAEEQKPAVETPAPAPAPAPAPEASPAAPGAPAPEASPAAPAAPAAPATK